MDKVDNTHMERILDFVKSENLLLQVSKDERKELPWCITLEEVEGKKLFLAHGVTLADALKRVSSYVYRIQAEKTEPTPSGELGAWMPGPPSFKHDDD